MMESKQREMLSNHTTPHISPSNPKPGYYALIIVVLLILIGCAAAVAVHIRRWSRLDELRHRLIPLYTYDPAEAEWGDEEEELAEPLCKDA